MYQSTDLNDNSDCDDCNDPSSSISYYRRLETAGNTYGRSELKFFDAQTVYQIVDIGQVVCINSITTGSGDQQFTGNMVTTRSVSWNFLVIANSIVPTETIPLIRLSLVWDLQPNNATAGYKDIYTDVPGVPAFVPFQHTNLDNRNRFIVLKTWVYPSPINGVINAETGSLAIDMPTVFPNGPVINSTPQTGALLLTFAQSGSQIYTFVGMWRTRYYDN